MTPLNALGFLAGACFIAALFNAFQRWRAGEFRDPFDTGDIEPVVFNDAPNTTAWLKGEIARIKGQAE